MKKSILPHNLNSYSEECIRMWINISIINWNVALSFTLTHYLKYKGSQIYVRQFFSCRYVIFFFPPNSMRRFKARRCYKDRVLMPTICCLRQCVNLEELYLEKADSPAITTYLLAHILKFLTRNELITCFHEFWIYQSSNLLQEIFFNFFKGMLKSVFKLAVCLPNERRF